MCGISGLLSFENFINNEHHLPVLYRMTGMLERRGPDDQGLWIDPMGRVGLGFRRLSILDLSMAGHQPMFSRDERSVVVLNGEIYNYQEIRSELESKGVGFRSLSDTEVLLEALNLWGIDETLSKANGMFGFAWYDRYEQKLILARDHAGIKPMYYALFPKESGMIFSSQYNVLLTSPWGNPGEVNEETLHLYLKLHHLPPPATLLKNTYQIEPGHYIKISREGHITDHTWWRLPRKVEHEFLSLAESQETLLSSLDGAIKRQQLADVPVGLFLSGGVDSPLVAAVAGGQVKNSIKAFTISTPGWGQDEAEDAKRYAIHLHVDHKILEVAGFDVIDLIKDIAKAQYEPFADFSIIPTMLVSRFARQEVIVSLSGDGGDELFFGYHRPLSLLRNGEDFRFPWVLRKALYGAGRLNLIPKKSDVIVHKSPADYYFSVNSWMEDRALQKIAPGLITLPKRFSIYNFGKYKSKLDLANYSRFVEYYGQLQRGLKKVDMASSYYALEVRVPLLDREVINTSLRIDPFDNMQAGGRKVVLRQLLGRYVPEEVIPNIKRGFAVPLSNWLRQDLRKIVEQTLFDRPLYPNGIFDQREIWKYWQTHLSGQKDLKWGIWTLLALQWWAMENLEGHLVL